MAKVKKNDVEAEENDVTEENAVTVDRSQWSDGEKIFVPKDIDSDRDISEFREYKSYKVRFFRTVPPNCVLVTKNKITQKIKVRNGRGLKLFFPWFTKTILVSVADSYIDYPKMKFKTKDGIEATLNLVLKVKISDPVLYMSVGKQQLGQLATDIQTALGTYAAQFDFDDINNNRKLSLAGFDLTGILVKYRRDYGISIDSVQFQEVELPKALQEAEQKRREALARQREKEIELEIFEREENLKREMEVRRVREVEAAKADAYVTKMLKLVEALKKMGIPTDQIAQQIQTIIAADNPNAHIILGAGNNNQFLAGMTAGQVVNPPKSQPKNAPSSSMPRSSKASSSSSPSSKGSSGGGSFSGGGSSSRGGSTDIITDADILVLRNEIRKKLLDGSLSEDAKSDYFDLLDILGRESEVLELKKASKNVYINILTNVKNGTFRINRSNGSSRRR